MYQEEVAEIVEQHLRTHLAAYLAEVSALYGDGIKLQMPKSIETSNLVGGVYNATPEQMPAYAIDIIDKQFLGEVADSLWTYGYNGHIAGVVSAGSESAANKLVKRHEQATELFIRRHNFMHQLQSSKGNDFRFKELGFAGAAFSGAELADETNRQVWIAGFRIDLLLVISESGPDQHA